MGIVKRRINGLRRQGAGSGQRILNSCPEHEHDIWLEDVKELAEGRARSGPVGGRRTVMLVRKQNLNVVGECNAVPERVPTRCVVRNFEQFLDSLEEV